MPQEQGQLAPPATGFDEALDAADENPGLPTLELDGGPPARKVRPVSRPTSGSSWRWTARCECAGRRPILGEAGLICIRAMSKETNRAHADSPAAGGLTEIIRRLRDFPCGAAVKT